MPALTNDQLALLDAPFHSTDVYFSAYVPRVLLSAQIAGTPSRYLFSYDNGASDDFSAIEVDYTLLIGTSPGLEDVGRVRLRSIAGTASAGTIKVSAHSFAWADNQYITVLELPEIHERTPFIDDNGVFFKDDDIPYIDQNSKPLPIPVMGPNRAGMIKSAGTLVFDLDGSLSYSAKSGVTISSFLWRCTGGTIASSTSSTTTISFSVPGHFILKLTVTDSNGKSKTSFRVIIVHSGQYGTAGYPMAFRLDSMPTADRDNGGASFSVIVPAVEGIMQGVVAILWQEMWFNGVLTQVSFRNEALCVGYVRGASSTQNWNSQEVRLEITTPESFMQTMEIWSASLSSVPVPEHWYEIADSYDTTAGVIHHYIEWHSTLINVCDVFLPTGHTASRSFDDIEGGKLSQVIELLAGEKGILGHLMCNMAGQIRIYQDIQILNTTDRAGVDVIATINSSQYVDDLVVGRDNEKKMSYVHIEGFNGSNPVRSKAPGDIPYRTGDKTQKTAQVLNDAAEGRERAGRILAIGNNPYTDIRVKLCGNWSGVVDISPQEWWLADFLFWENGLQEHWVGVRIFCKSVTYTYSSETASMTVEAVFEREAIGPDGIDDPYPGTLPNPGGAVQTYAHGSINTIYPSSQGLYIKSPTDGTWSQDTSIAGKWLTADPFWQVNQGSNDYSQRIMWICGVGVIYRREYSEFSGWVYNLRMPASDPPNTWSDAPAPTKTDLTYVFIEGGWNANGTFVCLGNWQNGASAYRSWLLFTNDAGASWQWISLGISL